MPRSLRSSPRPRRLSFESLEARLAPTANPIVQENLLPGNPQSEWGIGGNGDPTLQGFATNFSVNQGDTVSFKINDTTLAAYHIDIYRMGFYQGNGARKVATIPSSQTLRFVQPAPIYQAATNLVDAGNWNVAASWAVPANATSGVYIARLVREDVPDTASHIIFVVRDDDGQSDMLFQTSDTTWQAYNRWGGWSLYGGTNGQRAYKVSYNRPFSTRTDVVNGRDYFFGAEHNMIRWIESNGYNVSYFSGIDSDRFGSEILEHRAFLSVGHDEYWSGPQRAAVETARDAGVNLAFFSGNEVYWKTRWETSIDGSGTSYRTLVTYKETLADSKIDPSPEWTGTWRDPTLSPPYNGGRPENALTGTIFTVNRGPGGETGTSFNVPYEFSDARFWRNTSVANLSVGQVATLGDQVLGYEWDEDLDNGFRPAGLFRLSSTTQNVPEYLQGYGGNGVAPSVATHTLTMYRASSGALVFGAGTVQWSWGLDGVHDGPQTTPDPAMQQATVNLFADMGIQPANLQPGLQIATPSTDVTAPTSVITSPSAGVEVTAGVPVTITGTASDTGGGLLMGVEVSTDGGIIWRRATGRSNWSYTWTPTVSGPASILSRAVDDSGNLQPAVLGPQVIVKLPGTSSSGLVGAWSFNEGSGSTVTNAAGSGNSGSISGATWTTGQFGGALSFDGINDWVTVNDSNSLDLTNGMTLEAWVKPTAITDYTTIMMKERTSGLAYAMYASNGASSPPVVYINDGSDRSAVGTSNLPLNSWSHLAATYNGSVVGFYVNGNFVGSTPGGGPLVTSSGALRIGGNTIWGEFFKGQIDEVRIYNRALSQSEIQTDMSTPIGGSPETTAPTATLTSPAAGASVSGVIAVTATASDNVTVAGVQFYLDGQPIGAEDQVAPYSISWDTRSVPNGAHVLTARVRDVAGNTSTTSGTSVSVNNVADTTAPTVNFSVPNGGRPVAGGLALQADANDNIGVVSVQFKINGANLGAADTTAPYQALWDTTTYANGVYSVVAEARDAAGNVTTSVPVSVTVDNTAPTVSNKSPSAGAAGVATDVNLIATFNEDVEASSISFVVRDSANNTVAGQVTYDSATKTVTFNPNSDLALTSSYTATLSGVTDPAGNSMSGAVTWTFTTTNVVSNATLFESTAVPATESAADPSAIEVGMKFRTDIAGYITGIRFYKGAANTGTHIGHLWNENGELLATVTFTNESGTGWQQANFSVPVAILANTTYVVSYYAPNGGYSINANYFTSAIINGRVTGLANSEDGNGVYRYVTGGGYPTSSFNSSNYWVDVVFSNVLTDSSAPTVTARTPAANATDVALGSNISATFSESVQSSTIVFTLKDADNNPIPAAVTYDDTSKTVTLDPTGSLGVQASYTVILSGAKDAAGNIIAPLTWSFTTLGVDTVAPTVVSRTPGPGATAVAPAANLLTTFNEFVQFDTIVFQLRNPANTLIAGQVRYNDVTRTVTFNPTLDLATSTTYTATVSGAKDAAGNTMAAVTWSFTTDAPIVGQSLWSDSAAPAVASINDLTAIELGLKFQPTKDGYITGLRFYKGSANTGTHLGHLWDANGNVLGSATFTNESATGWQQVNFANAVAVSVNTTYVASYYAPNGGYAANGGYFNSSDYSSGPLLALASGASGGNGVYRYGAGGGFPTNSFNGTNYWVDVVFSNTFADLTGPTIAARTPAVGATGVSANAAVSVTFNEAVQASSISMVLRDSANNVVPATVSYDPTTFVATLTPTNLMNHAASYSVTVSGVKDLIGNLMPAPLSWSFTTGNAITNASIWASAAIPSVVTAADTASVELGLKFRSDMSGFVTAIRFYKGAGNSGTHVGHLWDAAGNQLAAVTFSNESASGWQTANLSIPVAITANTTYVVSYYAPNGGYSYDHGYFAGAGVPNSPLFALANGENGGNGLFRYGAGGGFPTGSYNSTNYWVDVIFTNSLGDTTVPTVTSRSPAVGAVGVAANANVTVTLSEDIVPTSVNIEVRDSSNNVVPGSISYNSATRTATFDPTNNLIGLRSYTVNVTGARDAAGNTMDAVNWTFTTKGTWSQTSVSDFSTGAGNGVVVSDQGGGALQLGSSFDEQFAGSSLGAAWSTSSWTPFGGGVTTAAVANGALSVQGAMVSTTTTFPGIGIEGRVNFAANPYQHFGLATNLDDVVGRYWAIFSTGGRSDTLYARVNVSGTQVNVELGALPSGFHNYKIVPKSTGVEFYLDGTLTTTINLTFPAGTPMKMAFSSFNGGPAITADWVRVVNYLTSGTFVSTTFDAGTTVNWNRVAWSASTPTGTSVKVEISVDDSLASIGTNWVEVINGTQVSGQNGRYVKYRLTLTTTDPNESPIFNDIDLDFI